MAGRTSTRTRRAIATWLLIFFVFPGMLVWWFLMHAVWFIGLLSIVALQLAMWGVVSAETPVEREK